VLVGLWFVLLLLGSAPAPAPAHGPLPPAQGYAPGLSQIRTVADEGHFTSTAAPVTELYVARNMDRQIKLTVAEYEKFRELIGLRSASAWDVSATFVAVQGPKILFGILVWILGLVIVRRMSSHLWDADIQNNAYASAVVLTAEILAMAIIVYGLVSA
jgi:hypothetical protein